MNHQSDPNRRTFLKTTAHAAAIGAAMPYFFTGSKVVADEAKSEAKNDRPIVASIGVGGRGTGIAGQAAGRGDLVALCDVDSERAAAANAKITKGKPAAKLCGDYRRVLDRNDVEIVTIGTPDHWHSKIAIEAMLAGKDVYCEKPLTLTIEEGKQIRKVVEQTGRVFQVGTQQRSEYNKKFLTAVALCHAGRLGKIQRVRCAIGGGLMGGPFAVTDPPANLDWEMWQGQTPTVPYIKERTHSTFRWWYEYSGGKMTDWGAHHIDIAQWAIDALDTGPLSVQGTGVHPDVPNGYNTATEFVIRCLFKNGAEIDICHATGSFDNGILIEGDRGRIEVNRGKLVGRPVEELKENPLPEDAITKLYKGRKPGSHMGNFFECVKTRGEPVSDVASHHRILTTCHLANLSIRLGRKLNWDPVAEQIVGDDEARRMQSRKQRKGYEIVV